MYNKNVKRNLKKCIPKDKTKQSCMSSFLFVSFLLPIILFFFFLFERKKKSFKNMVMWSSNTAVSNNIQLPSLKAKAFLYSFTGWSVSTFKTQNHPLFFSSASHVQFLVTWHSSKRQNKLLGSPDRPWEYIIIEFIIVLN